MSAKSMNSTEQFFYDNAGWSYDPKTETSDQGRRRGAIELARAEQWAKKQGYYFEWSDDIEAPLYCCAMYAHGQKYCAQSLGGIDTCTGKYARVVEAELVLQEMMEQDDAQQARELEVFTAGG